MCYSFSEIEWLSLTQEKILKKSPIRNQNLKSTQYKFVNKLYVITQYKKNALEKFNIKTLGCTRWRIISRLLKHFKLSKSNILLKNKQTNKKNWEEWEKSQPTNLTVLLIMCNNIKISIFNISAYIKIF